MLLRKVPNGNPTWLFWIFWLYWNVMTANRMLVMPVAQIRWVLWWWMTLLYSPGSPSAWNCPRETSSRFWRYNRQTHIESCQISPFDKWYCLKENTHSTTNRGIQGGWENTSWKDELCPPCTNKQLGRSKYGPQWSLGGTQTANIQPGD